MRRAILTAALVLGPAWGQINPMPSTGAAAPNKMAAAAVNKLRESADAQRAGYPGPGASLDDLAKAFDDSLEVAGAPDRIQLRGFTRGLKLSDYGAVFTAEVDLVATPTINIFQRSIPPQQVKDVHERKVTNLPLLRAAVRAMIVNSANALTALAPEGRIVVSVRLLYQSWEDRAGLPSQILMKGQRSAIQAGNVEVEEE